MSRRAFSNPFRPKIIRSPFNAFRGVQKLQLQNGQRDWGKPPDNSVGIVYACEHISFANCFPLKTPPLAGSVIGSIASRIYDVQMSACRPFAVRWRVSCQIHYIEVLLWAAIDLPKGRVGAQRPIPSEPFGGGSQSERG